MRNIKFRYIVKKPNGYVITKTFPLRNIERGGVAYWFECNQIGDKCEIYRSQYTGLKDKTGKEIFEGDIVKAHNFYFDGNFDADHNFIGTIKYSNWSSFGIKKKDGGFIDIYETSHFEEPCIENIGHESPELLEATK